MNIKQASKILASLGFNMGVDNTPIHYGTQPAEPFFPIGAATFKPISRDVFIGKCHNGWYVTSHLNGIVRMKWQRSFAGNASYLNIFGGGSTLQDAIEIFVMHFKSKTYNIQRI